MHACYVTITGTFKAVRVSPCRSSMHCTSLRGQRDAANAANCTAACMLHARTLCELFYITSGISVCECDPKSLCDFACAEGRCERLQQHCCVCTTCMHAFLNFSTLL